MRLRLAARPKYYQPESLAWFQYAGISKQHEKDAIDWFIATGKRQGWWSKLLYFNYFSPTSFAASLKDCMGLTTGTAVNLVASDWNSTTGITTFDGATKYVRIARYPSTFTGLTTTKASLIAASSICNADTTAIGTKTGVASEFSLIIGVQN